MSAIDLPISIDAPALLRDLEIQRCERSLAYFIKAAWHVLEPSAPYVDNWHIHMICLPHNALIETEDGPKEIGDIVECGYQGRILSYNHDSKKVEWRPIKTRMKNPPSCGLVRFTTESGYALTATSNHPVFVAGKGYVDAGLLNNGESVVTLRSLRDGVHGLPVGKSSMVQSSMLLRLQESFDASAKESSLQKMRKAFLSRIVTPAWRLLQYAVLGRFQGYRHQLHMPGLRRQESLGQQALSSMLSQGNGNGDNFALRQLWGAASHHPGKMEIFQPEARSLLLIQMLRRVFPGGEELGIHRRKGKTGLPRRVSENAKGGSGKRRPYVLRLWDETKVRFGRSPHRPRRDEQYDRESGGSVPYVSQRSEGDAGTIYRTVQSTISEVAPSVLLPSYVYNIEVEGNNNYFANGVLVHNCEHLEAIESGVEVNGRPYNRLLINLPPGGMKSLLLNVFLPSWIWGPRNKPHTRFLCAAHKIENLSARDAYKMRTLVTSDWYQSRWGDRVRIAADQRAKLNFANESTGFRIATAIGSLTGIRADYVLIDDPHSVESASSEVTMQSEVTNFLEAIPTRLNDPIKSVIIVLMQRLNESDISGVILDELNKKTPGLWDHVMLPMRFDPRRAGPTLLGTQDPREDEGELFFPDRFPLHVVERDEASLGPYGTASQFQQSPAPRGGGILKRDWWQLWEDNNFPPFDFVCASLDTAYTTKEENDYSAMTVWGVFSQAPSVKQSPRGMVYHPGDEIDYRPYAETAPKVLMVYAWQKRLEFPDLVQEVNKVCKKFSVDMLLIESKAAGISLSQELRRVVGHESYGVRLIDPGKQDKIARAYSIQHLFSEGIIYAPEKAWAEDVILQAETFPKGKHDDAVDTVTQALRFLRDTGMLTRAPERIAEAEDSMRQITRNHQPLYQA